MGAARGGVPGGEDEDNVYQALLPGPSPLEEHAYGAATPAAKPGVLPAAHAAQPQGYTGYQGPGQQGSVPQSFHAQGYTGPQPHLGQQHQGHTQAHQGAYTAIPLAAAQWRYLHILLGIWLGVSAFYLVITQALIGLLFPMVFMPAYLVGVIIPAKAFWQMRRGTLDRVKLVKKAYKWAWKALAVECIPLGYLLCVPVYMLFAAWMNPSLKQNDLDFTLAVVMFMLFFVFFLPHALVTLMVTLYAKKLKQLLQTNMAATVPLSRV